MIGPPFTPSDRILDAVPSLPNVTLCCVDTQHPTLAERALRLSMTGMRFGRVLLLTDRDASIPDVRVVGIPPLPSPAAHSQFLLKSLVQHIETDHVLLVQWDGYVINPDAWSREFACYDYIGARWPWASDGNAVGDGGFSLRSRRLLLALCDPRIVVGGKDDDTICRHQRSLLEREFQLEFAPPAIADRFSFHADTPVGRPFGFRGLHNFWRVVPDGEMPAVLSRLPVNELRGESLFQLGSNYLSIGQGKLAKAVFERIATNDAANVQARAALAAAREQASMSGTVGPRDPCPCGNGKRYKNCHGRVGMRGSRPVFGAAASGLADRRVSIAQELHRRGDVLGAEAIYRSVLAQSPDHRGARHFLGVLLCEHEDIDQALPLLKTSAEAPPANPDYLNNWAIALTAADRPAEAIDVMRRALSIAPASAEWYNTLGRAYQASNRTEEAIAAYRKAIAIAPGLVDAHWNLSLMLLLSGDYASGWSEYEWRLELPGQRARLPGVYWDGRIEPGLRLLIYAEQGFGDAIQFARYLAPLIAGGVRVFVYSPRALSRLFRSIHDQLTIVESGQDLPDVDAHFSLMSLARLFSPSIAQIPARVPYLAAPPGSISMWRQRLETNRTRLKVGLAWAGRTRTRHERRRPIPLASLAALATFPDTVFVSLQKDDEGDDRGKWDAQPPLFDWTSELHDFADTAALIEALDLVVSVDTGVAHLAGALGKRVHVLLPFNPDWRWLLNRSDSPWYPTARLFRQREPGNWGPVIREVMLALREPSRSQPIRAGSTACDGPESCIVS